MQIAHNRQQTGRPNGPGYVVFVVNQRQIDARLGHVAAHAPLAVGLDDDLAQRAVALPLEGHALADLQQAAHQRRRGQGAAEGHGGRRAGVVAQSGFFDQAGRRGGIATAAILLRQGQVHIIFHNAISLNTR